MVQDRSPFDSFGGPRLPRRRGTGILGVLAAVVAVLGLALGMWSLGNVDGVVPPVDPRVPSATPTGDGGRDSTS